MELWLSLILMSAVLCLIGVLITRLVIKQNQEAKLQKLKHNVARLDLSQIRKKILEKEQWSHERYEKAEAEYRALLILFGTYPNKTFAPFSEDCDEVWHYHILDTQKYPADCRKLFGRYIHHNPHMGEAQKAADENTRKARCGGYTDNSTTVIVSSCSSVSHSCSSSHSSSSSCGGGSSSSCGSSCGGGGGCGGGGCGGS